MSKKPSPWYWEARGGWFITRNGQHVNLGKHPADSPPPSKRHGKWVVPDPIMQAFYAAMTSEPEAETPQHAAPGVELPEAVRVGRGLQDVAGMPAGHGILDLRMTIDARF